MDSDRFFKVFDILDAGFRGWTFPAYGLIFIAIGVVLALFPTIFGKLGIPFFLNFQAGKFLSRYGFLTFAILWTCIAFLVTYAPYQQHKSLAQEGRCRTVQGRVERFVPSTPARPDESFAVAGVPFRYSNFTFTGGFSDTSSRGGPIRADQYVRICYDPARNIILRLEIRDFTGEAKNYALAQSLFPPIDARLVEKFQPPSSMQWLGNLFVPLLILDVFAIWILFLPYVRTFFRIKAAALPHFAIPNDLQPNTKIKLGNSMIYWDRQAREIWLRPRGFNLIQLPNTIAKLNVGPDDRTVVGDEIRLSPAPPVVAAALLWMFYQTVSPQGAGAAPLPMVLLPMIGVAFVLVGFLHVTMARRRMERLVQDALQDIRQMR